MITVSDLKKSFRDIHAVDGVTFTIKRGETFGLLGPNGAGKSTIINMIVGLLDPDEGSVSLEGVGDSSSHKYRIQIGAAPQSLALYDEFSARENLEFFAKLYGLSGSKLNSRIEYALELAALVDRKDDRIKTYSGGMKRRLNLACSMVHKPPFLALDEPMVGVDPQSRNLIFERIEELKQSGCTILYTTHYMEEAQRLCDRVAIMDSGQIRDIGTIEELIERHGGPSRVTAEFEKLPGGELPAEVTVEGLKLHAQTPNPIKLIAKLSDSGVTFRSLHVDKPNLETVFLNLTGTKLRD
jgi:linearmycin/streptolysin S transport system ATP-binding protein